MKVGDVVRVKYHNFGRTELGLVISVNADGDPGWIQHLGGCGYVGWCDKATPVPGKKAQRAIVNAAIANEALRRIDGVES